MTPISPGELHVWRVRLDFLPDDLDSLAQCLDADERRRAMRFVKQSDRRQFIVSHAATRWILGGYLGIVAQQVDLAVRPGGKPELAATPQNPPLRHNLSHCHGLAMLAVTLGREVGVDVEYVRPLCDIGNIVARYFASGEQRAWSHLPPDEQTDAFFRCWTREEAFIKAHGAGLSFGLDRFEVSLAPGDPARLISIDDPADEARKWQMFDLSPGNGRMAACVVEVGIDNLTVRDWVRL